MITISGTIVVYLFFDEKTGYSVIKMENGDFVIGNMPKFNIHDEVQFTGEWVTHPKYGRQFKASKCSYNYPTSHEGIMKFLSSSMVNGIGPALANRILEKFGESTIEIFEKDIEKLLQVNGIGSKKLSQIKFSWLHHLDENRIVLALQEWDINIGTALKIFKKYGEKSIQLIESNPYRLISDIWGIGFNTADKIAARIGFSNEHPLRVKYGTYSLLTDIVKTGNTYMLEEDLIKHASYVLKTEIAYNDPIFEDLESDGLVIRNGKRIYPTDLYIAEREIETQLNFINNSDSGIKKEMISAVEKINEKYSDEQLDAIRLSVTEKILIISGGPGTGKTTTIRGILEIYSMVDKKIMLAAPTGRAAKRMSEATGIEAKTIHRLLEYNPIENIFNYDADKKLECDLLIIDEVSMIDTMLMYNLISAVDLKTSLVLVGDPDQLPSIGPGNILRDLIESGVFALSLLSKIFRQAELSKIVTNAHRINKGEYPLIDNGSSSDFFFIEEENNFSISNKIIELCSKIIPKEYGLDGMNDVQILSPMYKGDAGVNNLNTELQRVLNSSPVMYKSGTTSYKKNDKVMQLRNNYDKGVFNGDIGFIYSVDNEKKVMQILYEGKPVEYSFVELDELTLAYAVTVHKSQGSEYSCVVVPMTTSHYVMLQRNLLYTAITRATKLMFLVGSKKAIALAVNNNKIPQRLTSLFKSLN